LHRSSRKSINGSTLGAFQKFQHFFLFSFILTFDFLISIHILKIGSKMNSKFKEMSQIFLTTWGAEIKTLTTWGTENENFLHG
jgi:hypothetical protein